MAKYIVRRLLGTIPVLFGLSIVLFLFIHALPDYAYLGAIVA